MGLTKKAYLGIVIGLLGLLIGCSKLDERKNVIGIWRLHSVNANGQEVSDGNGYLRFWEGGKFMLRFTAPMHQLGTWDMDTEKKTIHLRRDTSEIDYIYKMWDDSLKMTFNGEKMDLVMKAVKSDGYPIDPVKEGLDPKYLE